MLVKMHNEKFELLQEKKVTLLLAVSYCLNVTLSIKVHMLYVC